MAIKTKREKRLVDFEERALKSGLSMEEIERRKNLYNCRKNDKVFISTLIGFYDAGAIAMMFGLIAKAGLSLQELSSLGALPHMLVMSIGGAFITVVMHKKKAELNDEQRDLLDEDAISYRSRR